MPLTISVMAIASKPSPPQPRADRAAPEAYFVVSAIFHYLGPAFAVLLFARVDVLGVAWLRIASAAVDLRPVAAAVAQRARRPGGSCSPGASCWRR